MSDDRFAAFRQARERAASADEVLELGGHTFVIEPYGFGRYPLLLTSREFTVQLTDSASLPTALVQLRSEVLHDEEGPRAAFEGSLAIVESLCERRVLVAKASRLDVYADVAGWVLTDSDRRGIVTHAKLHPVLRAGTDEYETIQVGKQPLLTRLYRKDIERRAVPGFADHFWGGYPGAVVRVEAQAGRKKLSDLGIATVDDALNCYGNLWRHATEEFCRLHVPGEGDREDWKLDARWAMLQRLAHGQFPSCEMVPSSRRSVSRIRLPSSSSARFRRGPPVRECSIPRRRGIAYGVVIPDWSRVLIERSPARSCGVMCGCRVGCEGGTSNDDARRLDAGQRGRMA
jgi:hypothetical protein